MGKESCAICDTPAHILHSIHEGTGKDQYPDGSRYEPRWLCKEHAQEIIKNELATEQDKLNKPNTYSGFLWMMSQWALHLTKGNQQLAKTLLNFLAILVWILWIGAAVGIVWLLTIAIF